MPCRTSPASRSWRIPNSAAAPPHRRTGWGQDSVPRLTGSLGSPALCRPVGAVCRGWHWPECVIQAGDDGRDCSREPTSRLRARGQAAPPVVFCGWADREDHSFAGLGSYLASGQGGRPVHIDPRPQISRRVQRRRRNRRADGGPGATRLERNAGRGDPGCRLQGRVHPCGRQGWCGPWACVASPELGLAAGRGA